MSQNIKLASFNVVKKGRTCNNKNKIQKINNLIRQLSVPEDFNSFDIINKQILDIIFKELNKSNLNISELFTILFDSLKNTTNKDDKCKYILVTFELLFFRSDSIKIYKKSKKMLDTIIDRYNHLSKETYKNFGTYFYKKFAYRLFYYYNLLF